MNNLLLYSLALLISFAGLSNGSPEWNYLNLGPDYWPTVYPQCRGLRQSPINIQTQFVKFLPTLKPIAFNGYDQIITWNIQNNGHNLVATPVAGSPPMSISGSNFDRSYNLLQFHFHWGYTQYAGSEHYIDDAQFPLELHILHNSSDGYLAVVGFLFQIKKVTFDSFNNLTNAIGNLINMSDSTNFKSSLADMLPPIEKLDLTAYFRYMGSLTTPPCSENVTWTIYDFKLPVTLNQLRMFQQNSIERNFRDYRPAYGRTVWSNAKRLYLKNKQTTYAPDKVEI